MDEIHARFPHTKTGLCIQRSEKDTSYNCIAFAMHDKTRWWWPTARKGAYWPKNIPLDESVAAFAAMLVQAGYIVCKDDSYEPGYQKVAIFATGGKTKHMARQIENGNWVRACLKLSGLEHP